MVYRGMTKPIVLVDFCPVAWWTAPAPIGGRGKLGIGRGFDGKRKETQ